MSDQSEQSREQNLTRAAMKEFGLVPKEGPRKETRGLAKAFRLVTRQLLTEEEIQTKIRTRLIAELEGRMDVKITPTLMKIAAAQQYANKTRDQSPQWSPPTEIHVHLERLSDTELEEFVLRGVRPKSLALLPEAEAASEGE